ncbi:MAG: ElyC/SanA/YdcF family protein [Candidatus Pacebacteria bacterium]|nr:ElyC/SanA/YdcF family protein [Candidatus Paceibacterota bacterium]
MVKTKKISIRKKLIILGVLLVVVFILAIALIDLQVNEQSSSNIFQSAENLPAIKVALVLGASVWNNQVMSDMLKDRADTALDLYRQGKIQKILVSGDNRRPDYNEVIVVKNYLLEQGVPQADIFLDYAGFDTYDSLYRARDIFKVYSLVITTQSFHLPRAIYIAKNLGLEAFGLSADRHIYRNIEFNKFREKFANIKAFLDIKLHAKPKFLGEPIPIS